MEKFQYAILAVSVLFLVICVFVTGVNLRSDDSHQTGASSRDSIMQIRLSAIERAKSSGQLQYEFESIVAPPLM